MRSRIDIVFLDAECRVTNIEPDARSWRIYSGGQPAHAVLELPPGTIRRHGIARDDRIVLQSVSPCPLPAGEGGEPKASG